MRLLILALALLLLIPAPHITTATPPTTYDPAPCYFDMPASESAECGYVTVPENRQDPTQGTIRLYFAHFKSHRADPPPDPIVYLIGGPGVSGLYDIAFAYGHFLPYLANRDVIVLDQRGIGYSEPALRCDLAGNSNYYPAFQACAEDYTAQGVDLSAYTTAENAADVEALRLALGYEQWNVVGVSYGARLALMVLHNHPDGLRSVIVDSVAPLADVNTGNVYESTRLTVFEDCANDRACNAAYPNLSEVYAKAIQQVAAAGQNSSGLVFHTNSLRDFIYEQMWTTDGAFDVPRLVYAIANGQVDLIAFPDEPYTVFLLMNRAMLCSDYGGRNNRECQTLGMGDIPALVGNTPVESDVPTLIVNGTYDARTPTVGAKASANGLSNGYFYEFPYTSHGVVRSGGVCPQAMALAFLDDPNRAPDSTCMAALRPRFHIGL